MQEECLKVFICTVKDKLESTDCSGGRVQELQKQRRALLKDQCEIKKSLATERLTLTNMEMEFNATCERSVTVCAHAR